MDRESFMRLEKGDEVVHVVSECSYRVTSVVKPFYPRFRKIKNGRLIGDVKTFLAAHLRIRVDSDI